MKKVEERKKKWGVGGNGKWEINGHAKEVAGRIGACNVKVGLLKGRKEIM